MRRIPNQHEIAAMERGDKLTVDRTPKMHARKIRSAKEMRNGECPSAHEPLHKVAARLGSAAIPVGHFRRHRKAQRIKLQIPDNMLGIHRQHTECNATIIGMELVEVVL